MAKTTLNAEGESSAHALIRAGHYDMESSWSMSAEDENALLGPKGDDWDKYGRWHLGEDPSEPRDTKAHWKYPYGKSGKVYRRALAAIRSRASQNDDKAVFDAAGRLMTAMDEEEGKKESTMSLRQILGSRFGHFAGGAAAAKPKKEGDPEDGDPEAKKKAEEEEEAKRKAEEEEEAKRKARRARRAKKRQAEKEGDDEDADDAGDDDEEEDDDEEMKKAAAAGHDLALDAAFRAGARAQRRRCAAIFESKAAAANPVLAMSLAFETSMTADAAVAVLEKQPAPAARGALADRMAASGAGALRIAPSAPEGPKGPAAIASSWDTATAPLVPARRQ